MCDIYFRTLMVNSVFSKICQTLPRKAYKREVKFFSYRVNKHWMAVNFATYFNLSRLVFASINHMFGIYFRPLMVNSVFSKIPQTPPRRAYKREVKIFSYRVNKHWLAVNFATYFNLSRFVFAFINHMFDIYFLP